MGFGAKDAAGDPKPQCSIRRCHAVTGSISGGVAGGVTEGGSVVLTALTTQIARNVQNHFTIGRRSDFFQRFDYPLRSRRTPFCSERATGKIPPVGVLSALPDNERLS